MSTVVLTTLKDDKLDKNMPKCNFIVDNKNSKRKKNLMTDSFEKLDIKNSRKLIDKNNYIYSYESDNKLEKTNLDKKIYKLTDEGLKFTNDVRKEVEMTSKYKLDFKYSCMSFPVIYSKILKNDTRLQLNMDYDIYSFLNDNVNIIGKKIKKIKLSKLRPILIKNLDHMIKLWSSKTKEIYFYQKAEGLVDEYIRFKKELIFHLKNNSN